MWLPLWQGNKKNGHTGNPPTLGNVFGCVWLHIYVYLHQVTPRLFRWGMPQEHQLLMDRNVSQKDQQNLKKHILSL